jgi:two-component system nitrogen regulation response regulator GlnG
VKDLGSRNGTFVGDAVNEAVVRSERIGSGAPSWRCSTRPSPSETLAARCVGLVTASPTMQQIGRTVERLAQSTVSVLIQGEWGTGKELVKRAIHEMSARAKQLFIVVDLARCPRR